MNVLAMAQALAAGKAVRRAGWPPRQVLKQVAAERGPTTRVFPNGEAQRDHMPLRVVADDLLADDWELAP